MDEFKSHIGIAMRTQTMEDDLDLLAISGLSFIEDNVNDLETPCWICIINLLALEALDNPDGKLFDPLSKTGLKLFQKSIKPSRTKLVDTC